MPRCTRGLFWGLLFSFFTSLAFSQAPYGLDSRPPAEPFLNGTVPEMAPGISGNWSAVPAFPNLLFTNALGIAPIPGTTKLVVWEREGRIWSFQNASNTTSKALVLDIHNQCQGWDDSGLLGVAFHPGYESNHYVFVYYTWVVPGTVQGSPTTRPPTFSTGNYHDRLSRFKLDADHVAIAGSELVLVDQIADSVWHNGGGLFFHPDNGFLYWTDGDDESQPTQIIDRDLLSGVFRIDVDMRGGAISHPIPKQPNRGATAHYYVPNDNPFVGVPGALEEFFALGLRSPHRMTLDPVSKRIFIGDVGAGSREEIDVINPADPFGLNFQWSRIEGLGGDLTPPYPGVNSRPIIDYGHDEGQAVIGGYVYRGAEFAIDLGGRYIFGDNVQGKIWALDESTTPVTKKLLCVLPKGSGPNSGSDYTGLSSFGVDLNNELFLCQMSSQGGRIYKLARAGAPPVYRDFPPLLSQTGAFADLTNLTASAVFIPYDVNSALWSDAAHKSRWMSIPSSKFINFAPTGEWTFPIGSVWMKHFELATNEVNPGFPHRRLETRLLALGTNGAVFGATYKWRDDNSDADLLPDKLDENIEITGTNGVRTQVWHYPSRGECLQCHRAVAGGVLGVKTRQSNGPFTYPNGVEDNQLRTWNHIQLFSQNLDEAQIPTYPHLVSVTNAFYDVEARARSYIDANCSHCHRPGGVRAFWDGRIETSLAAAGIINGSVSRTFEIPGAKVVVPQHVEKSILYYRANSLESGVKMPPLARNTRDENALEVIAAWIDSLPPGLPPLPPGWDHADVGAVSTAGDASYVSGTLAETGSGDDIWNASDAFHFTYTTIPGNGEMLARVVSLDNTDGWAKAGIMIRDSLAPDSRHAFICVTPGNGTAFQRRVTTGGPSDHTGGPNLAAPYWVRLNRAGGVITASVSANGTSWSTVGTLSLTFPTNALIGFAVTAHNNSAMAAAVFDHVQTKSVDLLNWPPEISLRSPTNGTELVAPSVLELAVNAQDSDGSVARVEFFDGALKLGESTIPPFSFSWNNPALGDHSISLVAYDDDLAPATSKTSFFSILPITLNAIPTVSSSGNFSFSFNGSAGSDYIIEISNNLHDWTPWMTNRAVSGMVNFEEGTTNGSPRFFRVRPWSP
jgi:uncharacterized repeat protein (TIGR03806 family)